MSNKVTSQPQQPV